MKDTYRHKGMRQKLLTALRQKGITDTGVLQAMNDVPRHFFMEDAFLEKAYDDVAFPIGADQTISQPYTVAFMTQWMEVKAGMKILEIGTGSGYQACILAAMGAEVYTIERQQILHSRVQDIFKAFSLGTNIKAFYGDGWLGLPEHAPFDGIIVTAGASEVPDTLKRQLKTGGRLIIPVGDSTQAMLRLTRRNNNTWQEEHGGDFRFVPFLKGTA